ncbi:hypothetical protein, partial [Escherichia coli]|uniref:hypothetical protein n=1 Tax=Escherichia coli TaxID=562 RepID=UPI001BC852CE
MGVKAHEVPLHKQQQSYLAASLRYSSSISGNFSAVDAHRFAAFAISVFRKSSRQPGGCGLSWSEITVIKTDNIIVFQLVIWPVQLNPVNENL